MSSYNSKEDVDRPNFSGNIFACPNNGQEPIFQLAYKVGGEIGSGNHSLGMTYLPHLNLRRLRTLFAIALGLTGSGCSVMKTETFTFQAELPAGFTISATSYYRSVSGEVCSGHKVFQQNEPPGARLIELELPLTDIAKGCSMVLKSIVVNIEGQWGERDIDMSLQRAGFSIRDELSETNLNVPQSRPLVFQGQCQWFFRTMGPYRYIRKILECRALDEGGFVQKRLAGGQLPRDQLVGSTVKLVLKVAEEELPAVDNTWIKLPAGWKRCMGKNSNDRYAFCRKDNTEFTSFKMPDGRDCDIYPGCTQ